MHTIENRYRDGVRWQSRTADVDVDVDECDETPVGDLIESARLAPLWLALGWHDIKQRYRRSVVGPFWIAISTLLFLAIMSFLYAALFKQPYSVFLPMATAGLVTWSFISACLTEGARVFIDQSTAIKQLPLPLPVHVFRLLWLQFVIMLHNAVVIVLIGFLTGQAPDHSIVLILPAMALLLINLGWMALFLGVVSARYRDVPIIVGALMPIMFLATPIFWTRDLLSGDRSWIVEYNPIANMIEVVRGPVLGTAPPSTAWLACILTAVVGWTVTIAIYGRCRYRIASWV